MDVFAVRKRCTRNIVDQAGGWLFVGEFRGRIAAGLSLYQRCFARVLQGGRGLGGHADVSRGGGGLLVDYFWRCAAGGDRRELPSDRRTTVWRRDRGRTVDRKSVV